MNWNIPRQITQGDTFNWSQALADYKPADGTLKCIIIGVTKLDLIGVPYFDQWNFVVSSSQAENLEPGKYKTQFTFTNLLGNKTTLGGTELLVCPSFEVLTELETRSVDEIELEQVNQAIAKLSNGIKEYWIGDRKLEYRDLDELYKRQQYLRTRVAIASGKLKPGGRNIGVSFCE